MARSSRAQPTGRSALRSSGSRASAQPLSGATAIRVQTRSAPPGPAPSPLRVRREEGVHGDVVPDGARLRCTPVRAAASARRVAGEPAAGGRAADQPEPEHDTGDGADGPRRGAGCARGAAGWSSRRASRRGQERGGRVRGGLWAPGRGVRSTDRRAAPGGAVGRGRRRAAGARPAHVGRGDGPQPGGGLDGGARARRGVRRGGRALGGGAGAGCRGAAETGGTPAAGAARRRERRGRAVARRERGGGRTPGRGGVDGEATPPVPVRQAGGVGPPGGPRERRVHRRRARRRTPLGARSRPATGARGARARGREASGRAGGGGSVGGVPDAGRASCPRRRLGRDQGIGTRERRRLPVVGLGRGGPGARCASVLIRPPRSPFRTAADHLHGQARSSRVSRHSTGWTRPAGTRPEARGDLPRPSPYPAVIAVWQASAMTSSAADRARYDRATAHLDAPVAIVDLEAFDANADDLVRRAGGKPIRVASKSVRCRALLERVLARDGFAGIMSLHARRVAVAGPRGLRRRPARLPVRRPGRLRRADQRPQARRRRDRDGGRHRRSST